MGKREHARELSQNACANRAQESRDEHAWQLSHHCGVLTGIIFRACMAAVSPLWCANRDYPQGMHGSCLTIVVCYSGGEFPPLNGVDSEGVVPMAASDQELVVGREDKELGRYGQVVGKWTSNILPP